jgi:hypothetical protein
VKWFLVLALFLGGCTASRDAILAEDDALFSAPAIADYTTGVQPGASQEQRAKSTEWLNKLNTRQADRAAQRGQ